MVRQRKDALAVHPLRAPIMPCWVRHQRRRREYRGKVLWHVSCRHRELRGLPGERLLVCDRPILLFETKPKLMGYGEGSGTTSSGTIDEESPSGPKSCSPTQVAQSRAISIASKMLRVTF